MLGDSRFVRSVTLGFDDDARYFLVNRFSNHGGLREEEKRLVLRLV